MTPERWQRLCALYRDALERDPADRTAFLAGACGEEADLRDELESLLAAHDRNDGFLERPAHEYAASMLAGDCTLAFGQRVGRYRVLAPIGAGGMGEVYLAKDPRLGRQVALKLLPASLSQDTERVRRFEQEARVAAKLAHPNVCVIHEVGETDDGRPFIAMEYVDGVTLRERLEQGAVPVDEALKIAGQVASALEAAHAAGIVHRDLKPENLMLRKDGFVKVLDFGLAKLAAGQGPAAGSTAPTGLVRTKTGVVMGTARYMSPEQARGEAVDARSDVFSFGVVLYELLTGEQAFRRDSAVDTLHAIIHEEPAGLEALSRAVAAEVERVLRRCLEKEPAARYANGSELAEALVPAAASAASSGAVPAVARGPWPRWRPWWIALAAVALLAGGGIWLAFSRPTLDTGSKPASEASLAAMRTVPLTGLSGSAWGPAFSPDGSQVAFVWKGEADDNADIYVKLVDGGAPQRLTSDPGLDVSPVWSRDGHYIAFVRISDEERAIFVIPAVGGSERKLLTADMTAVKEWSGRVDWSPDGDSIAYSDGAAFNRPFGLYTLSVETLERQQLTSPPEKWLGDQQPAYSPDGTTLAFARLSSDSVADIYVMPAGGGAPTRLTFDNKFIQGLAWTPDGRSIVFSSDRGGTPGLWRVSATGGEPESLGVGGDGGITPAISRQGQRLAYTKRFITTSAWRVDLPASPGKTSSRTRVLSTTTEDEVPQISPDGHRIAFGSTRSGAREIWVCDSDGSNLLQLTALGRSGTGSPHWSPDGRSIAFDTRLDEQSDIYLIGANGGQPRRLTEDPADDHLPSWSRDGRSLYFASNRTGDEQIWKMPADGGDAVQITKQGGSVAFESPDGRYLYYTKDPPSVWRKPVEGGEEESVVSGVDLFRWAVVDKGIYFSEPEGNGGGVIRFFSFATRRVTRVAAMERPPAVGLAVSPDERWLLYSQVDVESTNIMLVENYR